MSAMRSIAGAQRRGVFRRRLTSRSEVKRASRACRSQNRRVEGLTSRSEVKRATRACRSQNRQLMRGGRA